MRRRTYHSVHTTTVAGLDQQTDVGVHEGNGHSDGRAIGKDEVRVLAELLDVGEDVVPATAVKTGAVVAELVDDLVHLESGGNSLNQDSTTDGTTGHANVVLGKVEDIVPESGLKVRFHLGKVEVRAEAAGNELLGVVVEVETEVEETTGDGLAINNEVLLVKVPASSTSDQCREDTVGTELVLLVALLEVDLTANSIVQVDLAVDHVVPGGSGGVLSPVSYICMWPSRQRTYPQSRPCRSRHRSSKH